MCFAPICGNAATPLRPTHVRFRRQVSLLLRDGDLRRQMTIVHDKTTLEANTGITRPQCRRATCAIHKESTFNMHIERTPSRILLPMPRVLHTLAVLAATVGASGCQVAEPEADTQHDTAQPAPDSVQVNGDDTSTSSTDEVPIDPIAHAVGMPCESSSDAPQGGCPEGMACHNGFCALGCAVQECPIGTACFTTFSLAEMCPRWNCESCPNQQPGYMTSCPGPDGYYDPPPDRDLFGYNFQALCFRRCSSNADCRQEDGFTCDDAGVCSSSTVRHGTPFVSLRPDDPCGIDSGWNVRTIEECMTPDPNNGWRRTCVLDQGAHVPFTLPPDLEPRWGASRHCVDAPLPHLRPPYNDCLESCRGGDCRNNYTRPLHNIFGAIESACQADILLWEDDWSGGDAYGSHPECDGCALAAGRQCGGPPDPCGAGRGTCTRPNGYPNVGRACCPHATPFAVFSENGNHVCTANPVAACASQGGGDGYECPNNIVECNTCPP